MRGMTEPRPDHLPSSLPFSQACENNQAPILAVLQQAFADRRQVLEVGSGTGQHGVYFAPRLPQLVWQTSDLAENHPGIRAWQAAHPAPNLRAPLLFDLRGWGGGGTPEVLAMRPAPALSSACSACGGAFSSVSANRRPSTPAVCIASASTPVMTMVVMGTTSN